MAQLSEHPSVKRFHERAPPAAAPQTLDARELRQLCLELGADDGGFVEGDRPELASERNDILSFFPHAKSLISFVVRLNREPIHNPARSVANVEFEQTGGRVKVVALRLEGAGGARGG